MIQVSANHTTPYTDPALGVTCTCGHTGQRTPTGGSVPHADDCALRIARKTLRDREAIERAEAQAQKRMRRDKARERRYARCAHEFRMISHEEARCILCGCIEFRADA